jgi:hypothetical protein
VNIEIAVEPIFYVRSIVIQVTGLIHLSEKYLIETLRNDCKKYVSTWLHDLEMINLDDKKDIIARHVLYKDGTRKHIACEIGEYMQSLDINTSISNDDVSCMHRNIVRLAT